MKSTIIIILKFILLEEIDDMHLLLILNSLLNMINNIVNLDIDWVKYFETIYLQVKNDRNLISILNFGHRNPELIEIAYKNYRSKFGEMKRKNIIHFLQFEATKYKLQKDKLWLDKRTVIKKYHKVI